MTNYSKRLSDSWQDTVALIFGLWLIASPWALGFTGISAAMWNAVIFGGLIVLMALMALVDFHEWEEWADMAIGLWLIVSPWALTFAATGRGLPADAATWNFVVLGLLTMGLAIWSLMAHRHRQIA